MRYVNLIGYVTEMRHTTKTRCVTQTQSATETGKCSVELSGTMCNWELHWDAVCDKPFHRDTVCVRCCLWLRECLFENTVCNWNRQCETYGAQLSYSAWLRQGVQLRQMMCHWDALCAIERQGVWLRGICVCLTHSEQQTAQPCVTETLQLRHAQWLRHGVQLKLCNWHNV